MQAPKVSIGMPVYNGEKYLRIALDCALRQDFPDFELIISDNASADGTQEICREYAARDPRIRYHRNETNLGASANYNHVFTLARGEFFRWASHDDEYHPSHLRRCLETFARSSPATVLVFSRAEIIDETGQVRHRSIDTVNSAYSRPHQRLASLILNRVYAHPLWGLIRADALRRTRLMQGFEEDHVLLAELALLGDLIEIPEVLYRLRVHGESAMALHRSPGELLAWHDPARAGKRVRLPHWLQWDMEYWRAIRHASLPLGERVLCFGVVPAVPCWHKLLHWTRPMRHRIGLRRKSGGTAEPFSFPDRRNPD